MASENIVITGSTGLLGSTLVEVLRKQGHSVYEMEGDIADSKTVAEYGKEHSNIDWIIHTAAITDVDRCEKDNLECHKVNVEGTKHIRELAKNTGGKLMYISTVSVFSGTEGNYKEIDVPYPKNFYNLTKLLGEYVVLEYPESLVLRTNLIGIHPKGSRGLNFFEWLVDSIQRNQDINLFTDVIVNPLSNVTMAEHIAKLIDMSPSEKLLHLASSTTLSKADIGRLVVEKFPNYEGKVSVGSIDDMEEEAARPKQMWLNSDYIVENLGLKMPTLESEVEKICTNYKQ